MRDFFGKFELENFLIGEDLGQYSVVYKGRGTEIVHKGDITTADPVIAQRGNRFYLGFRYYDNTAVLCDVGERRLLGVEEQRKFMSDLYKALLILEHAPRLGVNSVMWRYMRQLLTIRGEPRDLLSFIKYAVDVATGREPETFYLGQRQRWVMRHVPRELRIEEEGEPRIRLRVGDLNNLDSVVRMVFFNPTD